MTARFGGFSIPVPLVTLCAISIGGYVALDRWFRRNDERREGRAANLPRGFSALVASAVSSSMSLVVVPIAVSWGVNNAGLLQYTLTGLYILWLFTGAAFGGLAMRRAYQDTKASKLSFRFSGTVVFILDLRLCDDNGVELGQNMALNLDTA